MRRPSLLFLPEQEPYRDDSEMALRPRHVRGLLFCAATLTHVHYGAPLPRFVFADLGFLFDKPHVRLVHTLERVWRYPRPATHSE